MGANRQREVLGIFGRLIGGIEFLVPGIAGVTSVALALLLRTPAPVSGNCQKSDSLRSASPQEIQRALILSCTTKGPDAPPCFIFMMLCEAPEVSP